MGSPSLSDFRAAGSEEIRSDWKQLRGASSPSESAATLNPISADQGMDGSDSRNPVALIRTLRPDETGIVSDLTARIFAEPHEYETMASTLKAAYTECPFLSSDLCWVAEANGRIVAKWQLLDLQMRIAGVPIRMAGIEGVVAEPDENHKGYAKEVALAALPEIRKLDFDLVLGFAKRGAFYRRLGAVVVAADYEVDFDALGIPPLRDDPFREFDEAKDLDAIIDAYNLANIESTGQLVRTREMWPWLVRKPESIFICEDGYIGLTFLPNRLEIRELAGQGAAFHDTAIRKIAALARERSLGRICGTIPPDHPLVRAGAHYGLRIQSSYTRKSGCIALALAPVRLIGRLREALDTRLRESRFHDVHVDLGLRGPTEDERMVLNPQGREGRKIDLELPEGALLQLAMGHVSIESTLLAHPNACSEAIDDEALGLLNTIFPVGHPFMWRTDRY